MTEVLGVTCALSWTIGGGGDVKEVLGEKEAVEATEDEAGDGVVLDREADLVL
jgi:hypothetical protein